MLNVKKTNSAAIVSTTTDVISDVIFIRGWTEVQNKLDWFSSDAILSPYVVNEEKYWIIGTVIW